MISIVVPARNEEKHIANCIESLKKQEYDGDYEIVVVDNDSNDNTSSIASCCGAKVVFCPVVGIVDARQVGVVAAGGNIIVQVDADTTYPSDWLSRIASSFKVHPEIVAITGAYQYLEPRYWATTEYFLRNATILSYFALWYYKMEYSPLFGSSNHGKSKESPLSFLPSITNGHGRRRCGCFSLGPVMF